MSVIHSQSSWLQGLAIAHMVRIRLRPAPLVSVKILEFVTAAGLHFCQQPLLSTLHRAEPQLLWMVPLTLDLQLLLSLHPHGGGEGLSFPSHKANPRLISMTLPSLKTRITWKILTYDQVLARMGCSLSHLWSTELLCTDPEETLSRRFCPKDAGLFLITTNWVLCVCLCGSLCMFLLCLLVCSFCLSFYFPVCFLERGREMGGGAQSWIGGQVGIICEEIWEYCVKTIFSIKI